MENSVTRKLGLEDLTPCCFRMQIHMNILYIEQCLSKSIESISAEAN